MFVFQMYIFFYFNIQICKIPEIIKTTYPLKYPAPLLLVLFNNVVKTVDAKVLRDFYILKCFA